MFQVVKVNGYTYAGIAEAGECSAMNVGTGDSNSNKLSKRAV